MNIAITTWHSGPNAGTFFQVYGLYKYLERKGHHVEIIDYHHNKKILFLAVGGIISRNLGHCCKIELKDTKFETDYQG